MHDSLPDKMTIGERYRPAMEITDADEAKSYFDQLVERTMRLGRSRQEAEELERQNLGYFAGYYDSATMERVFELYRCAHPIFGTSVPTADEAVKVGMKLARGKE